MANTEYHKAIMIVDPRLTRREQKKMMRMKARYHKQALELAHPLNLPDDTEVEIEIHLLEDSVRQDWSEMGLSRLEQEWDNPEDAIYDDWKKLYGV